ncbi:hypothetical protein QBC47DRAFT_310816 [Echria macrotheca]|uniref:IPT/TIG domain-containing protein n=1 Tax=Echria macrotheca TaxID=438768 RepID=A0AAJ0B4G0_9PEZI|nr:hypothetical protein QBC47DRAFT_310816 [Echria macrotheca]
MAVAQASTPRLIIEPPASAKSRVETQIQLRLRLESLPPGIAKLHLPPHTISKPKFLSKPPPSLSKDMFELHVALFCTSAMQKSDVCERMTKAAREAAQRGQDCCIDDVLSESERVEKPQEGAEVKICSGCKERERKRASRKKSKKNDAGEEAWNSYEDRRVIVFNTHEVQEWTLLEGSRLRIGALDLPMRIACYCRHSSEKVGFKVIFTVTDFQRRVVTQAISDSIMITDDHKTSLPTADASALHPLKPDGTMTAAPSPSRESPEVVSPTALSHANLPLKRSLPETPSHPPSRPASPPASFGPQSKRRKPSNSKITSSLMMTPVTTTQQSESQVAAPQARVIFSEQPLFDPSPYSNVLLTPEPVYEDRNGALSETLSPPAHTVPPSAEQSRVASPNHFISPRNAFSPPADREFLLTAPKILKVLPNSGSKDGGYEITILGLNFGPDNVSVMFGDTPAITQQRWGPNSVVCMVPPSAIARTVPMTLKGYPIGAVEDIKTFTYQDHTEVQILRTALNIINLKSNGKYEDVGNFARRIVEDASGSGAGTNLGDNGYTRNNAKLESQLLRFLELIDLDESPRKPRWNLRRATGQALLHLACSLGLHRFVAGLIARGANIDLRDKAGFTPLHFASLNDHPDIVRRLLAAGADPTLRTLSGATAMDIAASEDVVEALHSVDRRTRSRSAGPRISAASSTTSLRSLSGPSAGHATEEASSSGPALGEESPEYSSSPSEEEESEEDGAWLHMASRASTRNPSEAPDYLPRRLPAASTAAMTSLKDQVTAQFQHIQQFMSPHLQNLPQFRQLQQQLSYLPQMPNFAQMPNIHPFPEYQAAVMQRLAAMVPAFGGRPGSNSPPPPSYDEIYPDQQGSAAEKKQESAARAAVEAEGDAKCTFLFDNQQTESRPSTSATEESEEVDEQGLPSLLQIGRKNAITKEQQENLRRAHAERLRGLSRDPNLFLIWIPLLLIVSAAMLYGRTSFIVSATQGMFSNLLNNAREELQQLRPGNVPVQGHVIGEV